MSIRPAAIEKLSGTISQELPEESRLKIRVAATIAQANIREAQRQRAGAAFAKFRRDALEFAVFASEERFVLEERGSQCLEAADAYARTAAGGLFHAYAAEWWSLLSPDVERFLDLLNVLGEQVEKELACPESTRVIRGVIHETTIGWMHRSARESIQERPERPSPAAVRSRSAQDGPKERDKGARLGNIDTLRRECGWSLDELAEATGLDHKLVRGHVKGKGAHPSTLKTYADAFSEKLGRTVSVADLGGQTS